MAVTPLYFERTEKGVILFSAWLSKTFLNLLFGHYALQRFLLHTLVHQVRYPNAWPVLLQLELFKDALTSRFLSATVMLTLVFAMAPCMCWPHDPRSWLQVSSHECW